jgi:hypothetical protein
MGGTKYFSNNHEKKRGYYKKGIASDKDYSGAFAVNSDYD